MNKIEHGGNRTQLGIIDWLNHQLNQTVDEPLPDFPVGALISNEENTLSFLVVEIRPDGTRIVEHQPPEEKLMSLAPSTLKRFHRLS